MEALRKRISGFFFKVEPSNPDEPNPKEILEFVEKQRREEQEKSLDETGFGMDQIKSLPNRETPIDSLNQPNPSDEGFHLPRFLWPQEPTSTNSKGIDYQLEFVNFVERNTPKGFPQKLNDMLPYMAVGFVAWPAYWLYRGYQWQHKRNTERIGFYIQRTHQQAKLIQVAILAAGLMMAFTGHHSGNILKVHDVDFKNKESENTADSD
ncbi:uncharacterized protein LOC117588915 [Drosophila guanche]|uniref:Uncharacterized protein n=1 Tax=Drosophila guanche TaxID=7266 RepID=A0A3B0K2S0_DROGU|nr:uncharacterized protein LOC117588915 [Drosophila guanche]SPP87613.1 Hypothetical predicted protein [Drosophila guanche]